MTILCAKWDVKFCDHTLWTGPQRFQHPTSRVLRAKLAQLGVS